MSPRRSAIPEGVWHFRDGGGWIVKGATTVEEAVETINSFFELNDDGQPEVMADINIYDDEVPEPPFFTADMFEAHGEWHRWVPASSNDDEGYPFYLWPAKPHARGAFQALLIYPRRPPRRQEVSQ